MTNSAIIKLSMEKLNASEISCNSTGVCLEFKERESYSIALESIVDKYKKVTDYGYDEDDKIYTFHIGI